MKAPALQIALPAAAAAALLAGAVLTARTLAVTPERLRQIERKAGDLRRLGELQARQAGPEAAVAAFAQAAAGPARPLAELLAATLPGSKANVQESPRAPLIPGWSRRQAHVILEDVRLEEAGRLLAAAEALRPPWRAAEVTVAASERGPGAARVTLILAALEAEDGPPAR